MATRYTIKDVRAAFDATSKAAKSVGIDPTGWILQEGSQPNGRAYRLFGKDMGNLPFTSGDGYIGATARQAYDTLLAYAGAWHAVAGLRREICRGGR